MNTRTAYAWFFFLLFTTGFISCGMCSKKLACPGYKDEVLDSWFPYKDGQQLSFRNSNNETETYTLENIKTTEPYETRSGGYSSNSHCEAEKHFQSLEKDSQGNSKATIILLSLEKHKIASFSIGRNNFNINLIGETSATVNLASGSALPAQRSSAILGNRSYDNLLEVTGDTAQVKTAGVYKLYFARGEGIVAFSEYPSLQTWVKQ